MGGHEKNNEQEIGPYKIREWFGEGGMGEVCRAYDPRLDREVAVKRIRSEKLSNSSARERFRREARAVARLNHPSIVQIYDLVTTGTTDWIVMELVEGETLSHRLRRGPLDPSVALRLIHNVAEGLAEAHENGVVHRDVKADNVMITKKGRAKLLDFGLVRPLEDDPRLTLAGAVVGTPHAMSPEQASGTGIDARSDIFSLGSLFFFAVTGRHPFRAPKVLATLHRVRTQRQPPAHWLQPDVPEVISELIDELLEKDPKDRPADTTALARRLGQLASTPFSDLKSVTTEMAVPESEHLEAGPHSGSPPKSQTLEIPRPFRSDTSGSTVTRLISRPLEEDTWSDVDITAECGTAECGAAECGAALVGREEELALVARRWQLVREGAGQILLLSGPAGIGKSHLLTSFLEREVATDTLLLLAQCHRQEQHQALAPMVRLLRQLMGSKSASQRFSQVEIEAFLAAYGPTFKPWVPIFAELFSIPVTAPYTPPSLSPAGWRKTTLRAIQSLLLELAKRQPVVLVIEDLHWMDPSTLELLDLLAREGPAAPLLTLLTTRSTALGRWREAPHLTHLTLGPLDRQATEQLASQLAGKNQLPNSKMAELITKSSGIPLFIQELTRGLLEPEAVRIPETLEDSFEQRLQRLGPAKVVAQEASVIGWCSSERLLATVSSLDRDELARHLQQLVDAEILSRRGLGPRKRYVWRHELIQDVTYQSLSRESRRQIHDRVVRALLNDFPKQAATRPELLAYHHMAATNLCEAVEQWLKAGQLSLERSATLEAVHQLRRGLEGVAQMPTDARRDRLELALYTHLGPALIATHGYAASDVEEAYTRMQQLCDSEPHHQALWELFSYHVARGELHHSQADAEKIMALAEKEQAASLLAQARHGVGICLVFRGELESSRPYLTPAADDEPKGIVHYGLGHDPGVGNTATLALTDWLEGRLASSLERIEAAQAQARRLDHPYTEGFAIFFAAWIHQLRGEPKPTEELSRELLQLARQQSFPWFVAKGEFFLGWALTTTGRDPESGMERIRASIQAVSANGVYLLQTHALAIYAELCLNRGLLDSAREALSEATQIYRRTGERFWEAEISRLGGEFLQQEGDLQGAQTAFRHALETSQRQGFHSLELAAALSLSRLLAASGERRAAREVLAGPYRLFARGELTPVVLAAGRELDELD